MIAWSLEDGKGFEVIFGNLVLGKALYYEVNASWVCVLGAANLVGLEEQHGRTVGYLFLACGKLSSHIGLACIGSKCIDGHDIGIVHSTFGLGIGQCNMVVICKSKEAEKYE